MKYSVWFSKAVLTSLSPRVNQVFHFVVQQPATRSPRPWSTCASAFVWCIACRSYAAYTTAYAYVFSSPPFLSAPPFPHGRFFTNHHQINKSLSSASPNRNIMRTANVTHRMRLCLRPMISMPSFIAVTKRSLGST